mgnify:CR=1 FL=1
MIYNIYIILLHGRVQNAVDKAVQPERRRDHRKAKHQPRVNILAKVPGKWRGMAPKGIFALLLRVHLQQRGKDHDKVHAKEAAHAHDHIDLDHKGRPDHTEPNHDPS